MASLIIRFDPPCLDNSDADIRSERAGGRLCRGWCDGEETTEVVPDLQEEAGVARRRRERPGAVLQKVLPQTEATTQAVAWGEDRQAVL